jgi:hypothetical protein
VDAQSGPRLSGMVTFAGVLALMLGSFNLVSGIAAIAEDDQTEHIAEVLFGVDITVWGWVWLILGAVQIWTGYMILVRKPLGLMLGVAWAVVSATLTVFLIFVATGWAITVLAIDLLIIYELLDNADEFS